MLLLPNTKENRQVAHVASTMAIEGMPLSREEVNDLLRMAKGEVTGEQLRKKVLAQVRNAVMEEHARR